MKPHAIPNCFDSGDHEAPYNDNCTEKVNSQNERLIEPCVQCSEKDLLIESIKSEYVIDKFKYEEQTDYVGHVNIEQNEKSDSKFVAKQALVFILTGINLQFEFPVAYYLIHKLNKNLKKKNITGHN